MDNLREIKGLLFDLDGVLYVGSKVFDGAVDVIELMRTQNICCRFITNTSTLSARSLLDKLNRFGFAIAEEELISAPQAAIYYLRQQSNPVCRFLLSDDVKQDFAEFEHSDYDAKYIVIGDIGAAWSYAQMNEIFNCLMNGAQLIAIHKNRFWQTELGLQMDIGGFVTALEYASNCNAMIIGKPSADFFRIALDTMRLKPADVAIIGDDIDADIGGGQGSGLKGILVRTGKYRREYVDASGIKPDLVIDSIKELPGILNGR